MTTYRIVPHRRAYRVEAVSPNGTAKLLDTLPTEEAAVARLRDLQEKAELANRRMAPGERDWRG